MYTKDNFHPSTNAKISELNICDKSVMKSGTFSLERISSYENMDTHMVNFSYPMPSLILSRKKNDNMEIQF